MRKHLRIFFTIINSIIFSIITVNNAAAQGVAGFIPSWIFLIPIGLVLLGIIWIQFRVTKNMDFHNAIVVWGIYPLLLFIWIFKIGYQALFYDNFKSRKFDFQLAEINNVYLINDNPHNRSNDNDYINFLIHGKTTLVVASTNKDRNKRELTHKTGSDCFNNSSNIHERLTSEIISNGYFDSCIISREISSYNTVTYDIKIRSSRDLKRFLGPCCLISEIHANHNGKDKYVGRWEYLGSSYKTGEAGGSFTFLDILFSLTGEQYNKRIKPYQFTNLNDELLRIKDAIENKTFLYKEQRRTILYWLQRGVFSFDYKRTGYELTKEEFETLKGLISLLSPQEKNQFTQRQGYGLSKLDKERIQSWIKDA